MSSDAKNAPGGLLMAMMEPPSSMEEEFQDWYDNEHFPERAGAEGFATAQRLICVQGWPRYLALYDLTSLAVMDGPGYAAIARNRYSRWTQRIIPRMWGHYRAEAEQLYPGHGVLGANGSAARIVLWRFRNVPSDAGATVVEGVRASFAETAGVLQTRIFQARGTGDRDCIATIELAGSVAVPPPNPSAFGATLRHLDLANVYTPYWR
jgi:hypothetical protein